MEVSLPERFQRVSGTKRVAGVSVAVRENRSGVQRHIWMAVDEEDADHLSDRQDIFLPTLAFYATLIAEDVDLGGARVDPYFVRNVEHAAQQYARWFHRLRVPLLTNLTREETQNQMDRIAAFCSGGIDGMFSVLRHTESNPIDPSRSRTGNLSHAYHVLYSQTTDEIASHGPAASALTTAVGAWGVKLVRVYSNIYLFAPAQSQNYAMITHGAAFASLAHALSARTGATMLASSHTDGNYMPYGSTPEVDPMFSSSGMAFIHDGSHYTRMEKVAYLCRNAEALGALNVCDRREPEGDYENCSRCHKCLRSMIAIDLEGKAGDTAPAFDWSHYSPEAFGRLQLRGEGVGDEQVFAEEIRNAARGRRTDIEKSATRALQRSKLFTPMFLFEDAAKRFVSNKSARQFLKQLKRRVLTLVGAAR
jgi:hypothetical protein